MYLSIQLFHRFIYISVVRMIISHVTLTFVFIGWLWLTESYNVQVTLIHLIKSMAVQTTRN